MARVVFCILLMMFSCKLTNAQSKYARVIYLGYGASDLELKVDSKGNAYTSFIGNEPMFLLGKHFERSDRSRFAVIGKLDPSGNTLWVRYVFEGARISVVSLVIDDNEAIYLTGTGSGVKLDDGTMLADGDFVIKFDKDGRSQWGLSTGLDTPFGQGQVAIMPDGGIFWAGNFNQKLTLGSFTLNYVDPGKRDPTAFIARISKEGIVQSVYQGLSPLSGVFTILPSDNSRASAIIRENDSYFRIVLDENCTEIDRSRFYDFTTLPGTRFTDKGNGYQSFSGISAYVSNGTSTTLTWRGFYKVNFDKYLNVLETINVDSTVTDDYFKDGLEFSANENYLIGGDTALGIGGNTVWYQKNGIRTILPADPLTSAGKAAYNYSFSRVVMDTLHLTLMHQDASTNLFTLEGRRYSTPNKGTSSWFWAKITPKDDGECFNVKANVVENGVEGSEGVNIRFSLPAGCPATEDISIKLSPAHDSPDKNENDFTLVALAQIKAGTTEAEITLPVTDDQLVEPSEAFRIEFETTSADKRYHSRPSDSFFDFTISDNDVCTVPPSPILADLMVCAPTDVVLTVKNPVAETYRLYESEQDPDPVQINSTGIFTVHVAQSGAFYVSSGNGDCQSTRTTVKVVVNSDFVVPNVFTPNGDGINDVWEIKNIENYPNVRLSVYNRYGSLVYTSRKYTVPFNGTSRGKELPAGAYMYVLQLTPDCEKIKGVVSIIR